MQCCIHPIPAFLRQRMILSTNPIRRHICAFAYEHGVCEREVGMKVEGQYPKVPLQEKGVTKGKEKEAIAQKPSEQTRTAEVKDAAVNRFAVNRIKEAIHATEDINFDRVEALKAKIDNGEYRIDKAKLAQKMLTDSIIEDA